MVNILQAGTDVLRQQASPVTSDEFGSGELTRIIDDMKTALHNTPDGVAIAAPQIGIRKRIFVVAGYAYARDSDETPTPADGIYINPAIVKRSKKTERLEEGCLSVRHYHGYVSRAKQVTVEAQTPDGTVFREGRSGLLAQIFQHEIDHLDGVLFIDKANDVEYREPDDQHRS